MHHHRKTIPLLRRQAGVVTYLVNKEAVTTFLWSRIELFSLLNMLSQLRCYQPLVVELLRSLSMDMLASDEVVASRAFLSSSRFSRARLA